MNRFVLAEAEKCIGCRTCEVACVLAHPGDGGSVETLNKGNFLPRLKVILSKKETTALTCRHCEDAPCVNVCPTGAIVYSNNSVQVVQERCIGCKTCAIACPYGAMQIVTKQVKRQSPGVLAMNAVIAQAHKCDLCAGQDSGPACIPSCPTQALYLIDPSSMEAMLRKKQERAVQSAAAGSIR